MGLRLGLDSIRGPDGLDKAEGGCQMGGVAFRVAFVQPLDPCPGTVSVVDRCQMMIGAERMQAHEESAAKREPQFSAKYILTVW